MNDSSIWITTHTGSRQFGKCVCEYWQNEPFKRDEEERRKSFEHGVKEIKKVYKGKDIQSHINKLKEDFKLSKHIPHDMDYLIGDEMYGYLTDMIFTTVYAMENRNQIIQTISNIFDSPVVDQVETLHNYIDFGDFIIRKGAIAAYKNKRCIIPFNMEDGILICTGKSNSTWNYSAPHGAGRIMSRSKAKKELDVSKAEERMRNKDIFTSVIPTDEMKEAYKDPEIIEKIIEPTVEIIDRLVPIMNLKNGKTTEDKKNE